MVAPAPTLLPDRIRTPRLVLRRWQHDEAAALGAAVTASLDHLRPWMGWIAAEPLTIAERVALIERWTQDWEAGGDSVLGVFLDGEPIGGTGYHRRSGPGSLEIGYWIHVDHLRRGYAGELTSALTTEAFRLDGIERVDVCTDEANEASGGVPATLGFRRDRVDVREPQAPAETGRLIVWTMARGDWPPVAPSTPSASSAG